MNQIHTLQNRQTTRLKTHNYAGKGVYFLTLCVEGREPLFGTIENGEMKLNAFGKIVAEEWEKSAEIRDNIFMGEYIIMPDHFHGIIEITNQKIKEGDALPGEFKSPSNTIGAIIRGFKGASTKRIKSTLFCTGEWQFAPHEWQFAPPETELKILKRMNPNKSIWQRNYHDKIIRDPQHYENTINYIKNNPFKWQKP
jgi:REP element-mobilizing transposase RayT